MFDSLYIILIGYGIPKETATKIVRIIEWHRPDSLTVEEANILLSYRQQLEAAGYWNGDLRVQGGGTLATYLNAISEVQSGLNQMLGQLNNNRQIQSALMELQGTIGCFHSNEYALLMAEDYFLSQRIAEDSKQLELLLETQNAV